MSAAGHLVSRPSTDPAASRNRPHRVLRRRSAPVGLGTRAPAASWRSGWTALIVSVASRATLALLASLLFWSVLPAALGWHTTVVMSGSMEPRLHPGDVIASRPVSGDKVRIGQVLLVNDPDHAGRLRLHRLAVIRPDGLLTLRGDANGADDSTPVARSAVKGVGSLRIPCVGMPAYLLQTGQAAQVGLLGLGLLGLGAAAFAYRDDEGDRDDNDRDDDASRRQHDGHETTRRPAARAAAAVLTALAVTVTGIGAAGPAAAATLFRSSTGDAAGTWSAAPYFSCVSAALADRPYLLYPLSDNSRSTASDASGNNRDGHYEGNMSSASAGPCGTDTGGALTLGGHSWISTPGPVAAPTVFSLEIWFKTTTRAGGELIGFGNQSGASTTADRHLFLADTGELVFGVSSGGARKSIVSTSSYNDGTWHLADATLSSAGMRLYVDGSLVAADNSITTAQTYSGYWHIGYNTLTGWPNSPSSEHLAATIADAAVYAAALTPTQIGGHYAAG